MTAGRVGRPHGRDGTFHLEEATHAPALGETVRIGADEFTVGRRAGTDERPLIRLDGVDDPSPLRGAVLLVEAELEEDEWLASALIGRTVAGHGRVERVVAGPSCSVLELSDGTLVPFVRDAIRSVGPEEIEVEEGFLG